VDSLVNRCSSDLRYHSCDSAVDRVAMRNHADMGPIALSPNFTVSSEADPAENYSITLLTWNIIRSDGKLLAVQ
jgi:hypothetical protein